MAYAVVEMGWSPSEFWRSTPRDFWAAQKFYQQKLEAQNDAIRQAGH